MDVYTMTEAENLLAALIWEKEPIGSGDLVKLASQRLGWKKSTTYTVLRRMCKNDIFQNKAAVVTSKMTREEYAGERGRQNLEKKADRPRPGFAAAFTKGKKSGKDEIDELVTLVGEYGDEYKQGK